MEQEQEYECGLTGVTTPAGIDDDSDGLADLPAGWTCIQVRRREYNPKWLYIQQVKERMVAGLLSQLPPELQEVEQLAVHLQVEAQFHSLESATPVYNVEVETVYISDSGEAFETYNEVRELLGLPPMKADNDNEEEEEEEEIPDPPQVGDSA